MQTETIPTLNSKPRGKRKAIFTGFGAFLIFVFLFAVFALVNFHTIVVKGESMEPTFMSGQRLVVSSAYWLVGDIKKNDIVVVKDPDEEYIIKRVYALGGDTVDLYNVPKDWSLVNGEYKVPDGEIYILGDNRPVSEDSRAFGPIDRSQILGKVVVVGFGPPPSSTAAAKSN